ncbi:MAG: 30S ribosomal protein S8 [Deltaproteobacteria bacterium]|nr:30S ribosomal protein S8 [Deltaproteobacteria bacterium]
MGMSDPIADMLTRVRNANRMKFKSVDVLLSKLNINIAKTLKKAGYISGFDIVKNDAKTHDMLRVHLKYTDRKERVITGIQRMSKPGRRMYTSSSKIPKVLNGFGISVLSTSRGVMTDAEARALNVGGEILCNVW